MSSHKVLPNNFKQTMLAKFGMKNFSLNPIPPDENDLNINYLAREKYINIE
jgi:hypothetical protein